MSLVNYATREITCKIVYYGPGRSGKTTNLQYIHAFVPDERKGAMVSLATETDRTLFFDFLPLDLGTISGFATRFQLYTVPGQVYYAATRNAMESLYSQITEEARHEYTLAYVPRGLKHNSPYHKVEVRVAREAVTIKTRQGYYTGPTPGPAAE